MDEKKFLDYGGYKIDPIIFTQGFVTCCDLKICSGQCCDWGVYMDSEYKNVILDNKDMIMDSMDEYQTRDTELWFDKELTDDTDFPSGKAIGTEVYETPKGNTQCVFKDSNGFCTIQLASVKAGKHKWSIKPKYCIMYPITVVDNTITYDDSHSENLDYCGLHHPENFTQTVFEAMHEEIKYIFGDDMYNFLEKHFRENYKKD
jgi:hypothetical protein